MIDEDNSNSRNIDPFISIFLDGKYKSIDLVPIKITLLNSVVIRTLISKKVLQDYWLLESTKLVWRILHDQNRTNSNITDEEIKNIELFIQFLSNYENSTKIGIIVSRNIEQHYTQKVASN